MKTKRAMLAGLAGAASMSAAMWLLRLTGQNVSLEALLGSAAGGGMAIGMLLHLGVGAAAGLVYAAGFEFAIQRSSPFIGAGFGLSHCLLAGLFMSAIPAMNPFGAPMGAPGAFLSNLLFGPFEFVALHVLFGAVVGVVYGPALQRATTGISET